MRWLRTSYYHSIHERCCWPFDWCWFLYWTPSSTPVEIRTKSKPNPKTILLNSNQLNSNSTGKECQTLKSIRTSHKQTATLRKTVAFSGSSQLCWWWYMEAVTCLTLRSGWKRMMYSLGVKRQASDTVALRLIVTLILVMRRGRLLAVLLVNRINRNDIVISTNRSLLIWLINTSYC